MRAVFFDFDHTLITHDSNFDFFVQLVGWPRMIIYSALAMLSMIGKNFSSASADTSRKTYLKAWMVRRVLTGRTPQEMEPAIARLCAKVVWNDEIVHRLKQHDAAGDRIVIASGGMNIYLPTLCRALPHHDILCTEIEVGADGCYGERFVNGNCVRDRKKKRVQDYIEKHGPFTETWAYGNWPADQGMFEAVQNKVVV
ncbi:MAG: hypothetical protein EBQ89_04940 [Alphaproteobacteria bacterium]|nr:hypothetical protein [Alphaproteobacteria bacterium]